MLQSLEIENVAIIEKAGIEFSSGFNVLTGETGAGKSIIIDSINAVMGERTSREIVRTGAQSAKVSAVFTDLPKEAVEILRSFEIETDGGELLVQRTVGADGRSSCRVNGMQITASMLRNVGNILVNIHGQHDSQALLNPETHYSFIDSLAGNAELLENYFAEYENIIALKRELKSENMDEAEKSRQLDMLSFQVNELEAADIKIGETQELNAKRTLYLNSEKVINSLRTAYQALVGDDEYPGAVSLASTAADSLSEAGSFSEEIGTQGEALRDMSYNMEEYASDIRRAFESLEFDSADLAEIEERLDVLYRLSKKYGQTEEEMLEFLENAKQQMKRITLSDERVQELRNEIAQSKERLIEKAKALSVSRSSAARDFEEKVKSELEFLSMPGVVFSVSQEEGSFTPTGRDVIEFLISANAGESLRPLAKTASGGELSRIMLAIKNVLSDKDNVGTLIFDEIDTGVSGKAAYKVGQKLRDVANGRQVLCVTHLPQIAVFADCHMMVEKNTHDGKTYTKVNVLNDAGRANEIARLTGSGEVTPTQLDNALEMLRKAREI